MIRAIDGPLAERRRPRPEDLEYAGSAEPLRDVWVAVRAQPARVLERMTLADVAAGKLPAARGQADEGQRRLGPALDD